MMVMSFRIVSTSVLNLTNPKTASCLSLAAQVKKQTSFTNKNLTVYSACPAPNQDKSLHQSMNLCFNKTRSREECLVFVSESMEGMSSLVTTMVEATWVILLGFRFSTRMTLESA